MVVGTGNKLILAFVTLIIGILLLASVSTEEQAKTTKTGASESVTYTVARLDGGGINTTYPFTMSNAPTGWKVTDCPLTNFEMRNASGTSSDTWTSGTDYSINLSSGVLYLRNTAAVQNQSGGNSASNASTANYHYCGNDYLNLSWGRTVLDTVPGFFAIALLLVSVALFFSVAKDNGIV